jgi:Na+/proline symporter
MNANTLLAAEVSGGQQALTSVLFLSFVAATLVITIWASRQTKTATDFYAGGRSFSGVQLRHSSASPASSRSTATTVSCTPSASLSRGSLRFSWLRS